jgi:RNA polymerase sigma-70 factor, ECF subfamily
MGQRQARWQNRAHVFAIATQIMRRILVNHARDRAAEKRGGAARKISLDDEPALSGEQAAVSSDERAAELTALEDPPRPSRTPLTKIFVKGKINVWLI